MPGTLPLTTRRLDLTAEPIYCCRVLEGQTWGFIGVVVEPALVLRRTETGLVRALSPSTTQALAEPAVAAAWRAVLACAPDVRIFPDPERAGLQFAFLGLDAPAAIERAAQRVVALLTTLRAAVAGLHRDQALRAIAYRHSAVDTAQEQTAIQQADASSQRALRRHHRRQTVQLLAPIVFVLGLVGALLGWVAG
ncbi:MAG: hypothetical protein IT370_31555 [Deltaproteobacteria bacterium]|nr:hypothetical protein [Deltaproteobacteria bacterium]